MRGRLGLVLGIVLLAASASAQVSTVPPGSSLLWDQTNVADAATAQAFTYRIYVDGSTTGTVLTGVTCATRTSEVALCTAPFPAFTPGVDHTIALSAGNADGESPASVVFRFRLTLVPSTPQNLRSR